MDREESVSISAEEAVYVPCFLLTRAHGDCCLLKDQMLPDVAC